MQQLKDIKNIVVVPDNSLIWLIVINCFIVIILILLGYFYFNKRKKIRKNTTKKDAIKVLHNLNFSNSKEVAYHFSLYGHILINENNHKIFVTINKQLIQYKYKKEVSDLNTDLILQIKGFTSEF